MVWILIFGKVSDFMNRYITIDLLEEDAEMILKLLNKTSPKENWFIAVATKLQEALDELEG